MVIGATPTINGRIIHTKDILTRQDKDIIVWVATTIMDPVQVVAMDIQEITSKEVEDSIDDNTSWSWSFFLEIPYLYFVSINW